MNNFKKGEQVKLKNLSPGHIPFIEAIFVIYKINGDYCYCHALDNSLVIEQYRHNDYSFYNKDLYYYINYNIEEIEANLNKLILNYERES